MTIRVRKTAMVWLVVAKATEIAARWVIHTEVHFEIVENIENIIEATLTNDDNLRR